MKLHSQFIFYINFTSLTSLFELLLNQSSELKYFMLRFQNIIMKVTKNQVCKSSFSNQGVLKFDAYALLHTCTCINIKSLLIATVHACDYEVMNMLF